MDSLETLKKLKKEREDHINSMIKLSETDNIISELILAYQGQKDQAAVFTENLEKYNKMKSEAEEKIKQRSIIFDKISDEMSEFIREKTEIEKKGASKKGTVRKSKNNTFSFFRQ